MERESEGQLLQNEDDEDAEDRQNVSFTPESSEEKEGPSAEEATAQKRRVRGQYRKLRDDVETGRNNLIDTSIEALGNHVLNANKLFKEVKGPAEAILDSKVLLAASDAGAAKARQLKMDSNAFDVDEFLIRVARFMGGTLNIDRTAYLSGSANAKGKVRPAESRNDRVDRKRPRDVGEEEGSGEEEDIVDAGELIPGDHEMEWYKCVPKNQSRRRVDVMYNLLRYGPLETDIKVRNVASQRQRFKIDDSQRVRPEEIKSDDITKDPMETSKMVTLIFKTLQSFGNTGVPYLKFIVNPESFPQTVENMFYFSFLVKEGRAAIQVEEDEASEYLGDTITYATVPPTAEDLETQAAVRRQMVFELTQDVWRSAVEAYDIVVSCIPARDTTEGVHQPGRKQRW